MIRNDKLISDNRSVSSMSIHRARITNVSPDRVCIPWKKEKKNPSEILITGNKITQETDNTKNKAKLDISIDETKNTLKLTPPPYKNRQDYFGGTNDKTRESD